MTIENNPFLMEHHTPHGTIPFHLLKTEHFEPAFQQGMEAHNGEIDAIINNPDVPDFYYLLGVNHYFNPHKHST